MQPTDTASTFLFADVPDSSALWDRDPSAMVEWLQSWDKILPARVSEADGRVVRARGEDEGYFCVFQNPSSAIRASVEIQRDLADIGSEVDVRIGVNSGSAEIREGDYYGAAVNKAARLKSLAHPGQILLGHSVIDLLGVAPEGLGFKDLGSHRLKDLSVPERIFQLTHPDLVAEFPGLRSLDALPHNLPVQLTTFVGRSAEMTSIKALLGSSRLVTLTGPGGAGKTRLALQVGAELIDGSPDGVWLVDLAPQRDPSLVHQAALSALGLREAKNEDPAKTLQDHLRQRRMLMILDNSEHLIEACAELTDGLLRTCPGLQILATSREPLGVGGEVTFRIPSLQVPDPTQLPALDKIGAFESVDLFINRATAVEPAFKLDDRNAPWIAQLCNRLDGMPLAIELAAARVRVLSPEQIASRLDDRFQLLSSSSRTALPRQKTLRALIDWSYDLLSKEEKTLWRRMSWFAGGCTIAAVEAVCTDQQLTEADVLDLLTQLVDKSLLLAETQWREPRYRQLESIREYGLDKLKDFGEEDLISRRHAEWFLKVAEDAEAELWGPEQAEWLDRLEHERANLRTAMDSLLDQPGGSTQALRIAAAVWEFCEVRGHFEEGRRWIQDALVEASDAPGEILAKAMRGAGNLAFDQGDLESAATFHSRSLEWERKLDNKFGQGKALNNLGVVEQARGDLVKARAHYQEALDKMRELQDERGVSVLLSNLGSIAHHEGDPDLAEDLHTQSLELRRKLGNQRGIAHSLNNLGNLAKEKKQYERARELYAESLQIREELGDRSGIGVLSHNLAGCALEQGDVAGARVLFTRAITIHSDLGDKKGVADSLEESAKLVIEEGDLAAAAIIYGAAATLRQMIGASREGAQESEHFRSLAKLKDGLGEDAFGSAWKKGAEMDTAEAIAFTLGLVG